MENQELFNTVVRHLHKQGRPAMAFYPIAVLTNEPTNQFGCAYRGDNGNMCAVGCLIKDEFYRKELEGESLSHNEDVQAMVAQSIGDELSEANIDLLGDLQVAHDGWDIQRNELEGDTHQWAHILPELQQLVASYNLVWPEDVPIK